MAFQKLDRTSSSSWQQGTVQSLPKPLSVHDIPSNKLCKCIIIRNRYYYSQNKVLIQQWTRPTNFSSFYTQKGAWSQTKLELKIINVLIQVKLFTSVCKAAGIRSLRHNLNTVFTKSRLGSCPLIPSMAISKKLTFSSANSKFSAAWIEPECPSRGAEEISVGNT